MRKWTEITPSGLAKRDRNHPWVFAVLWESPSDREDDRDYEAFLFRDRAWTTFGIMERFEWTHLTGHRNRARRVIQDAAFRQQLVSPDPRIPAMWPHRTSGDR